jgi:hypothetical protein
MIPRDLDGVHLLEVVTFPTFLDYEESNSAYSASELEGIKKGKRFLYCRVRVTFQSGKVLDSSLLLYPYKDQTKVWGMSVEGERKMHFSDIASVKIQKEEDEQ